MSSESGLTCDEILEYLLQHDGRVRNKEFVTHFKHYLTGSPAQEEARLKFKEFVNYLATTKKEDDVKYVILRKKFFPNTVPDTPSSSSLSSLSEPTVPLTESTVSLSPRAPPPYRPPPPVTSPTPSVDSMISRDEFSFDNVSQCSISSDVGSSKDQHDAPPQAPPRRRTLEKLKIENKENISNEMPAPSEAVEKESTDSEIVSVKERMQKFNRMAETDLKSSSSQSNLRKRHEKGADDDDGVSVTSMDTKTRDWIIRSSLSDYQVLAKLATENPRLVRFKDPITGYTALHWAAKHGNEDVIKLIAGTHGANVNVRTNGGYTPLHLAAQFGHENIYDLLVKVYKADQNIRDWSGKKAYSYLQTTNKSVSAETFRNENISNSFLKCRI